MRRRTIALLIGVASVLSLTGCEKDTKETSSAGVESVEETAEELQQPDVKRVAVLLKGTETEETQKLQEQFRKGLEESGYNVCFAFAGGDANLQNEQLKENIELEADVLVIEPVEAYALTEVLSYVEEKEIPVISYDELIMDSAAVSYYTTYSYRNMGQMIGEEIKKEKNLDEAVENQVSYNIEFLMGSQDSLEALFFYNGVMEVLQSYFDAGVLVCPSGKNTFDANGILRWDAQQAGLRCEEMLETFYQEGAVLDIICTGFDAAAVSASQIMESAGYDPGTENWPLITGIGCDEEAVELMKQDKIYCSIYMDEEILAETCVKMIDACIKGEKPEVNDSVQYDNGVKIIETNICEAKLVNADNADKFRDDPTDENTAVETTGISEETVISEEISTESEIAVDDELDNMSEESL